MVNERNRSQEDERICKAVERMKWRNRMKCTSYSPGDGETGERVSPEDLNTGPDTTENIEEQHEMTFKSCRTLANFVADNPTIIPVSVADDGSSIRLTYKNSKNMDNRFKYEPDPEDPGKMRRVNCRPEDGGTIENLVKQGMDAGCEYLNDHVKISKAMNGWSRERNTDFPGAAHGEQWLRESEIRDSGDVMFGVDCETQGLQGNVDPMMSRDFLERYREPIVLGPNPVITPGKYDDEPYPTTADMKNYIDELCNKNVSPEENKHDPGDYYSYSNILKRMDDTHRRKNSDYGDAAYKGYKKFGDYYFIVQLHNKYHRLESLTIGNKSQQVKDESIDDTLLDMANYAVMYLESRHRDD